MNFEISRMTVYIYIRVYNDEVLSGRTTCEDCVPLL